MSAPINDGGPAFPFVEPATQCGVSPGMTLRDWFAATIPLSEWEQEQVARIYNSVSMTDARNLEIQKRYAKADAMLAARRPYDVAPITAEQAADWYEGKPLPINEPAIAKAEGRAE